MLTALLLQFACLAAGPYQLGIDPGWAPGLAADARDQWVLDSGGQLPRVEARADLFGQPGGSAHLDHPLRAYAAAGLNPLLFCYPGAPRRVAQADGRTLSAWTPSGLDQPVLLGPSRRVNPANAWAVFIARLVERYDADGLDDAPGSPKVTWLTISADCDGELAPDGSELARLLFVAAEAARQVSSSVRLGLRVDSPETLQACLSDPAHPAGRTLEFLYLGVPNVPVSFSEPDLLSLVRPYQAALRQDWLTPELLVESAPVANEAIQRAAVPKAQIVAAALDLSGCLSPPLFAPVGRDALLRPTPGGHGLWQPREAYWAYQTLARLLRTEPEAAPARFSAEVSVGNDARCYRFTVGARELLVVWATDPDGEPSRQAALRLPLRRDIGYGRYTWEYSRVGRPAERVVGGPDGHLATVGIDPEYYLEGAPRLLAPVTAPAAGAAPPWRIEASDGSPELGFDGNSDTVWQGGAKRREPWWQIRFDDAPVTAERVRLRAGWLPGVTLLIEVSDDGAIWRTMSRPARSLSWDWQTIPLTGRVTSTWWRVRYETETDEPVSLFEIEFGERSVTSR